MAEVDLKIKVQEILENGNTLKETNKNLRDAKDALFVLRQAGQGASDVAGQLKSKIQELDNQITQHKNNIKDLTGKTSEFTKNMGEMKQSVESIKFIEFGRAIQEAVKSLVEFGKGLHEIALKGAEFDEMKAHFDKMNGGIGEASEKFELLRKASAGTLNDEEILKYVNRLDELGYSTTQSIQVLDIATTKHHELGINIEAATDKLTRFIETGNKKGLQQLGISFSEVNDKAVELAKTQGFVYSELDETSKRSLRLQAVLETQGSSVIAITEKEQTHADKLKAVEVELKNAELRMGSFISEGLVRVEKSLGLTNKETANWAVGISKIGGLIIGVLPAIGGLSTAMMSLGAAAGPIGLVALAVGALAFAFMNAAKDVKLNTEELIKNQAVTKEMDVLLKETNISAQNMAEAYKGIGDAIEFMTKKQLASAKQFVEAEIAKIQAMKETFKETSKQWLMKTIPDFVPPQGMDKWMEEQGNNIVRFTDAGANLEKLQGILEKINVKEKFSGDDDKTPLHSKTTKDTDKGVTDDRLAAIKLEEDTAKQQNKWNLEKIYSQNKAAQDYLDDLNKEFIAVDGVVGKEKERNEIVKKQIAATDYLMHLEDAVDKLGEDDFKRAKLKNKTEEDGIKLAYDLQKAETKKTEDLQSKSDVDKIVNSNEREIASIKAKYSAIQKEIDITIKLLQETKALTDAQAKNNAETVKALQKQKDLYKEEEKRDLQNKKSATNVKLFQIAQQGLTNAMDTFFNTLMKGGTIGDAFKGFLKGMLEVAIQAVEAKLVIAKAAAILDAIITGGISVGKDIAELFAAITAISMAKALVGSFAGGGYTGDGGKYEPAGVVHKGEVVFSQSDVSRIGLGNLLALRGEQNNTSSRSYANGGYVGGSMLPNITVVVNSELEASKVMKFGLNYMPAINRRLNDKKL